MMCEFHGSNGKGLGNIWWTDTWLILINYDLSKSVSKTVLEVYN